MGLCNCCLTDVFVSCTTELVWKLTVNVMQPDGQKAYTALRNVRLCGPLSCGMLRRYVCGLCPRICLEILRKTTKDICETRRWPGRLSNLAPPKHKEQASVPTEVHGVMCQRPVIFTVTAWMTSDVSPASVRVQIPARRRDISLVFVVVFLSSSREMRAQYLRLACDRWWPVSCHPALQPSVAWTLLLSQRDMYCGMVHKVHHYYSQNIHLTFGTLT